MTLIGLECPHGVPIGKLGMWCRECQVTQPLSERSEHREQGPAIDPEQARQWAALVVNPDACVPETANLARWALARDAEATRLEQENARLRKKIEDLNDEILEWAHGEDV